MSSSQQIIRCPKCGEAIEESQQVIDKLRKQLIDVIRVKDELALKLEKSLQQKQFEALEHSIEEKLKAEFPYDDITSVEKGVEGVDIIQKVFDNTGRVCGQILWRWKQTKNWQEPWIQKLKDDQENINADIVVIVSTVLPNNVKTFTFRDGVWICDVKLYISLASALRINLISVIRGKEMEVSKKKQMEFLYSYLSGAQFIQRVETIVGAFDNMERSLKEERMAYEKIWAERENQIKNVIENTAGIYWDLNGLVALTQSNSLELGVDSDANNL